MAKKYSQDKSKKKGIITGGVGAVLGLLIYSSVFPTGSFLSKLIMVIVTVICASLGYIMGSGLDTTKEAPKSRKAVRSANPQVDMLIEKGQDLLSQIRKENERIPDPKLSRLMDEMESIAGKIYKVVEERPEKAPQVRRFMEYYLPTTLNMLKSYRRLSSSGMDSKKAEETLVKIENAMEVIIGAFKKQLNTLYRDDILDVSADMSVLETLLKQDKLIDDNTALEGNSKPSNLGGSSAFATKEE
jgi:5-bromo-4-chloroindolyl phosphate hydrolysis protein